ncbi:MAG: CapA family protein [Clostridia bacterium]|nr:CapA family protein [Clostridia bacterium]
MKRFGAVLLAAALLVPVSTGASGSWTTLSAKDELPAQASLVQEYTGTVRITFLGDCTLGGEEKSRNLYRGFVKTVERNGYAWPFRNLTALTAGDDLTVANLEGVLSDRELNRVGKEFNFRGPTAYTEILEEGSVECVTLANNHSHDYENAGYEDTVRALEDAGVAYFSTDRMAVWRNSDGLMIGFLGVSGSLSGSRFKAYEEQAQTLKLLGCAAVITVMHTGTEYEYKPDGYQRQVVNRALSCGTDLIIGHHPHVVQGYELADGVPVVYSLGNCVFGGNTNPRDHDALAVQAELSFEDGELAGITLRFYPISVSGEERYNDYSPVLLSGENAERVLRKMEASTGVSPGVFTEGAGAAVTVSAP